MLLGVLGGLGPMSSVYFYELVTSLTCAERDQDHIDIILSSAATTPDRTAYILGRSQDDPASRMVADAKKLVEFGADVIAVPCNTAHYFYEQINDAVSVPVLNIINETARYVRSEGFCRPGILATEGTVRSESYAVACAREGIACGYPTADDQQKLSEMIYGCIKQGGIPDFDELIAIADRLERRGCDCMVLGCTELSLIRRAGLRDPRFIDSLEVLARRAISFCGKSIVN